MITHHNRYVLEEVSYQDDYTRKMHDDCIMHKLAKYVLTREGEQHRIPGCLWSVDGVDMCRFVRYDPRDRKYTVIFEAYELEH